MANDIDVRTDPQYGEERVLGLTEKQEFRLNTAILVAGSLAEEGDTYFYKDAFNNLCKDCIKRAKTLIQELDAIDE